MSFLVEPNSSVNLTGSAFVYSSKISRDIEERVTNALEMKGFEL